MSRYKLFLGLAILLFSIILGFYSWASREIPNINRNKISVYSVLEYPSEFNYRQTVNGCGPFSVAAVVRFLTKEKIDSRVFAQKISWKLPNKYTLPWGLERQLKENGIDVEIFNIKALSDEDKIYFLQEQLSQNKPLIILGEVIEYEHYITIFGFNSFENEFYVYDSFFDKGEREGLTKDENDVLPGNRSFTSKELLDFWRGGGMYGFYTWYAIVASYE